MITSRCFHLVCVNSTSTGHVGRPNLGIFSHLWRVDLSWTNLWSMQLVQKHGQFGSARCSNYTHPICKMIFSYLSDLQYNKAKPSLNNLCGVLEPTKNTVLDLKINRTQTQGPTRIMSKKHEFDNLDQPKHIEFHTAFQSKSAKSRNTTFNSDCRFDHKPEVCSSFHTTIGIIWILFSQIQNWMNISLLGGFNPFEIFVKLDHFPK